MSCSKCAADTAESVSSVIGSPQATGAAARAQSATQDAIATQPLAHPYADIRTNWANAPFREGTRVVLANGRHGTIIGLNLLNTITIGGGNRRATEFGWFTVQTDNGAHQTVHALDIEGNPDAIQVETEPPSSVVKDIEWKGEVNEPESVVRAIHYARKNAQNARGAARRARLNTQKQKHLNRASQEDKEEAAAWSAFETWAREYPDAARTLLDEMQKDSDDSCSALAREIQTWLSNTSSTPTAQVAAVDDNPYAGNPHKAAATFTTFKGQPSVEIRFPDKPPQSILADLHNAGFRWSRPQRKWYAAGDKDTQNFALKITGAKKCPQCGQFMGQTHACPASGVLSSALPATVTPQPAASVSRPVEPNPAPAAPAPSRTLQAPTVPKCDQCGQLKGTRHVCAKTETERGLWQLDADDWKAHQKTLRTPNGQPDHAAIGRATALRESGAESAVLAALANAPDFGEASMSSAESLSRADGHDADDLARDLDAAPVVIGGAVRRLRDKGLIGEQGGVLRIKTS